MKKLSLLLCLCALVMTSFAQLPSGSYAPAFTGYQINKSTGNIITDPIVLHDLTDSGYVVFMDVFATWCGPCWSYHTSGQLENLYSQYGPQGTNELRVLAIEGSNGNYASLSGSGPDAGGSATQGNWLNGVEYPIIPLHMSPNTTQFDNDYAIAYFPTIYMVCPNRLVFEVGQQSTDYLHAATGSCPDFDNTQANNALLLKSSGIDGIYYCSCTANPTIDLQNVGSATLTSATLIINYDGQTSTYEWTGSLGAYQKTTVSLPQITSDISGTHTYSVQISTVNGVSDVDTSWNTKTTNFKVAISPNSSTIDEDFSQGIPSNWTNNDRLLVPYNLSGDHGGAVCFNAYNLSSGTISELDLPFENLSTLTNPVLIFDLAHKRYSSSYNERLRVRYSTDCGATWQNAYSKSGSSLSTSTGNISSSFIPSDDQWREEIVDLSSITNNDDVIIRFEFKSGYGNNVWIDNVKVMSGTGIEDIANDVNVYPNPATDVINIKTPDNVLRVEVYSLQGQLVKIETGDVNSISVKDLANGMYTLKLTTDKGTSIHKIVKK